MSRIVLGHCPPQLRADAAQEAWLATAAGRSANGAVVSFLRRERKHRERERNGILEAVHGE